jgi:uracil-DNA glycosylase
MAAATLHELFDLIPPSWKSELGSQASNLHSISHHLLGTSYIPQREEIFACLKLPPSQIRVVIIGQDPYPNREHAMGLAFSVRSGVKPLPASMRNIFTELYEDVGIANQSGDLKSWCDQGVLLINRILTTVPESSLSHSGIGWEEFTDKIIQICSASDPVAILWGKKAQELSHYFDSRKTISSAHPSPLSAYRGFFGSKPFSRTNEILLASGRPVIDWRTY